MSVPLATTTYQVYLSLHILAAVLWVGGAVMLDILVARTLATGDARRAVELGGHAEWLGGRVFAPLSLIVLVFGFLLASKGNWDFEGWLIFGLVAWGISAGVGMAFFGPESGRILRLAAETGDESREVQARIRRLARLSIAESALLVLVVLDMASKPGL
jgi:uncharacterized membrane protein